MFQCNCAFQVFTFGVHWGHWNPRIIRRMGYLHGVRNVRYREPSYINPNWKVRGFAL
jgi:hypothetical protein